MPLVFACSKIDEIPQTGEGIDFKDMNLEIIQHYLKRSWHLWDKTTGIPNTSSEKEIPYETQTLTFDKTFSIMNGMRICWGQRQTALGYESFCFTICDPQFKGTAGYYIPVNIRDGFLHIVFENKATGEITNEYYSRFPREEQ